MAKGRPMAGTLESLLAPLPPASSRQEFQACFPWGCAGPAGVTRTRSESPSASWLAAGGSSPTPPFCTDACPPSTLPDTRVPFLRVSHFRSHARRSSRSLCAGALPHPRRSSSVPPAHSHTVAHTHGHAPRRWSGPPRARGGPAPLPWPYLCGGLCRGAAPVHGARRPASAAHSRSPPRRGDSGRFEFTTARPVPNLPPPGSQRHVTTGAAEASIRGNVSSPSQEFTSCCNFLFRHIQRKLSTTVPSLSRKKMSGEGVVKGFLSLYASRKLKALEFETSPFKMS
nr:uncharacterized protein LOC129485493 [Symphalangus syndactylus]